MKPTDAAILTAIALVIILLIAWYMHRHGGSQSGYCSGPSNIGLYDHPYLYPAANEGRQTVCWDGDRRCAAFCQQSPCTVWCR
jgi:hypothetical protein